MNHTGALYKFDLLTLWEGVTNFQMSEGTKTLRIAMKFGMVAIGLEENAMSNDELARKIFFLQGTLYGTTCRLWDSK